MGSYPQTEDPTAPGDPYAQWKGGEFIPIGSSFQATPQWWEPVGPFSIGPFSGEPTPVQQDLRAFWAPAVVQNMDQNTLLPDPTPNTPAIYQAYSRSFGTASAPAIPTSGSSLHGNC